MRCSSGGHGRVQFPPLPFVSAAPVPAICLQNHTGVTAVFSHVMPSNSNGNPRAAIANSALRIRALRFTPEKQTITVSQAIQAQSLTWPVLATDMLSYSRSSPQAYIQAGMEVMPRLFGSPPSQQILEYTTQAKQDRGPLHGSLVLHSPGITFGKCQRGT